MLKSPIQDLAPGSFEENEGDFRDAITPDLATIVRLAFHDCQPYVDGSGGCDGCINFDVNVAENDVLQHSVAILVSFSR